MTQPVDVPENLALRAMSRVAPVLRRTPRPWRVRLAWAAAVLIAFLVGAWAEAQRSAEPTAESSVGTGYLFVFSGSRAATMNPADLRAIGRAFATWTDSLARLGQLVAQGQLTRAPARRVSVGDLPLDSTAVRTFDAMESFYVLRARDDQDAWALARSCPYLRFGGTIVIRRRAGPR